MFWDRKKKKKKKNDDIEIDTMFEDLEKELDMPLC